MIGLDIQINTNGVSFSDNELELINQSFDKLLIADGIIPQIGSVVLVPVSGDILYIKVDGINYLPECYIEFKIDKV